MEYLDRHGDVRSKEMFAQYAANSTNDPLDIEFGRRLKEVIKNHGITNKEAIEILGWTYSTFYGYSRGVKKIRINRFAQIVDKLFLTNSEVAYLLEVYLEDENGQTEHDG